MRIPSLIRESSAHLYTESAGGRRPVGTAFGLCVEFEGAPGNFHAYWVTARHVINGARGASGKLYVRLNRRDGVTCDVAVPPEKWTCHHATDIAALPIEIGPEEFKFAPLGHDMIPPPEFFTANDIGEGDEVFTVGLFTAVPGRTQIQPLVRSGRICLGRHEPIPIRSDPDPGADFMESDVFLIETLSWGGLSGAPVYFAGNPLRRMNHPAPAYMPLIGLIHGHLELPQRVKGSVRDDTGAAQLIDLNSGVAIVVPVEYIVELLNHPEFVEQRRVAIRRR